MPRRATRAAGPRGPTFRMALARPLKLAIHAAEGSVGLAARTLPLSAMGAAAVAVVLTVRQRAVSCPPGYGT